MKTLINTPYIYSSLSTGHYNSKKWLADCLPSLVLKQQKGELVVIGHFNASLVMWPNWIKLLCLLFITCLFLFLEDLWLNPASWGCQGPHWSNCSRYTRVQTCTPRAGLGSVYKDTSLWNPVSRFGVVSAHGTLFYFITSIRVFRCIY